MARRRTKEEIKHFEEAVTERYPTEGGWPLVEEFGVSFSTVQQAAKRLGVPAANKYKNRGRAERTNSERKYWTPENLRFLQEHYEEDGLKFLVEQTGVPKDVVTRKAKELNLQIRDPYEIRARNKTNVDVYYFDGPWTPEMAYIVGYTYADGSVGSSGGNPIRYHCTEGDSQLLYGIREILKSQHTMTRSEPELDAEGRNKQGLRSKPSVGFTIGNCYLSRRFQERFGLTPRKSYKDVPFPSLPPGNLNHFSRGYLDGDGTVSHTDPDKEFYIGLYGTYAFIKGLRDAISLEVDIRKPALYQREKEKLFTEVKWYASSDLWKLYHWLYAEDTGLCLLRKKQKLEEALQGFENEQQAIAGRNSNSGYRGVSLDKSVNPPKHRAKVHKAGVDYYLGQYDTPLEAAYAYNHAAKTILVNPRLNITEGLTPVQTKEIELRVNQRLS